MCMCEVKPNVNGQPGYSWDGKSVGVRPVDPPPLLDGDTLYCDEPGRCGGVPTLDGHSHHFRVVINGRGDYNLLVQHGGGTERIALDCVARVAIRHGVFADLDSHARYWLLYMLWSTQRKSADEARSRERARWSKAAVEKRIKVRKKSGVAKVVIEE